MSDRWVRKCASYEPSVSDVRVAARLGPFPASPASRLRRCAFGSLAESGLRSSVSRTFRTRSTLSASLSVCRTGCAVLPGGFDEEVEGSRKVLVDFCGDIPSRLARFEAQAPLCFLQGIVNAYSDETPGRDLVDEARAALTADEVARATDASRRLTIREALGRAEPRRDVHASRGASLRPTSGQASLASHSEAARQSGPSSSARDARTQERTLPG